MTKSPKIHNFGLSSLLVVFVTLSLLTFAALSLSSAQNDYQLSRQLGEHRREYYAACSLAEDILLELNRQPSATPESLLSVPLQWEGSTVSYRIPVGQQQFLSLTAAQGESGWYFRSYALESSAAWQSDTQLNLIPLD